MDAPLSVARAGVCFGTPEFGSYLARAAACGNAGGRLASLGELTSYRGGPGAAETGIECSSEWDPASIWCAGNKGAISGLTLENQAQTLATKPAMFRCVTYLKD